MAAAAPLFDAAQLTSFFEGQDYMALTNRTCLQLALEGITVPDDFIDFDADGLEGIFLNLQKPPKVLATGAAAIAAGRLREIMAYEVSAKSKMRLKGAQKIAKFYENVGGNLDPQNMTWLVIKRFLEQWKALMERKKEDFGLPPKLTKHHPVHKWMESMVLYLGQKVGVRNAPLAYVVWAGAIVPAVPPPLQAGKPHSEQHGSIEGDLIGHMTHNHALFKVDNGAVYDMIESSTRGSDVTSSIAPFRKTRDGRGALNALKSQHAGKAVYDRLVKEAEQTLSNKVWNGNTSTSLASHMGAQRKAWQECADHIPVDVPNEQARVTYLMDSIKTTDPTVLAALAAIRQDELDKRVNFENSFAYLVPVCPVADKAAKKTKVSFDVNVSGAAGGIKSPGGLGGGNPSPGKGESGVSLRYHTHKEFLDLNKDQRNELSEWTKANGGKKKGGGKRKGDSPRGSPKAGDSNKRFKTMISEMEGRQNKMFEAMAEVQQSSIAAIHASASPEAAKSKDETHGFICFRRSGRCD